MWICRQLSCSSGDGWWWWCVYVCIFTFTLYHPKALSLSHTHTHTHTHTYKHRKRNAAKSMNTFSEGVAILIHYEEPFGFTRLQCKCEVCVQRPDHAKALLASSQSRQLKAWEWPQSYGHPTVSHNHAAPFKTAHWKCPPISVTKKRP